VVDNISPVTEFHPHNNCVVIYRCFLCPGAAEVSLPVDRFTKKIKGFAHVKFSPPETAVKALADLDGSIFQVVLYFGWQRGSVVRASVYG